MNTLTVTYTGPSDDLLDQAIKDLLQKFGYEKRYFCTKGLSGNCELNFKKD